METLIGILVMVLAVFAGILIGVLFSSLFYGRSQKKPFKKLPPVDMLKEGYFDEARVWVNPAQDSMIAEIDGEFHRDYKLLSKDQKRRVNYLQQLFKKWSDEEEAPLAEKNGVVTGNGWEYELNSPLNPPAVFTDLENSMAAKEGSPFLAPAVAVVPDLIEEITPAESTENASDIEEPAGTGATPEIAPDLVDSLSVDSEPSTGPAIEEFGQDEPVADVFEVNPVEDVTGVEPATELEELANTGTMPDESPEPLPVTDVRELTVTEQVNEKMQSLLIGTSLENENISLVDDQADGVIIKIGQEEFRGVESVPFPQVRELIRQSVQLWKQGK